MPLKLKPAPLGETCEIVSAAVPELLSVSDKFLLEPIATEPKLRLDGVAAIWPPITPVPDSGTFNAAFGALLVRARLPLKVPLDCGAKLTV